MKTLHSYLLRQILGTLAMTVLVFAFVLMLCNAMRDILALLINRQVQLWTVLQAVGLLIPYVLIYALPMGLLTATLLTFGRFSADQELTAARAGGISLAALVSPVLLLAVAACGLSAVINLNIGPWCRGVYRELLFSSLAENATALIPEGRFVKDFKGFIFYVDKVRGDTLSGVQVYRLEEDKGDLAQAYIRAATGRLVVSSNRSATLFLYQVQATVRSTNGYWLPGYTTAEVPVELVPGETERTLRRRLSDMTFSELQANLRDLERRVQKPLPLATRVADPTPRKQSPERQRDGFHSLVLTEMNSRVSFAFSCFSFTLVGIPLGIRAHRRETSIGSAIALVLVLIYYSLITLGESLATHAEYHPYLIVWLPNILFQTVGAVLFWRANRGL